jgi:hypothetical protein
MLCQEHGVVDAGASGKMAFWHLRSQAVISDAIILWLGDRQGCSAVASAADFFTCASNGAANPAWTDIAEVLAIDAPGVGMSAAFDAAGQQGCTGIGDGVLAFLKKWLKTQNGAYSKHRFFVFGQGDLGHCIPSVGHILAKSFSQFAGVGLGNAIFNTQTQMLSYPTFLKKSGLPKTLLSGRAVAQCAKKVKTCNKPWPFGGQPQCVDAWNVCGQNMYDVMAEKGRLLSDLSKSGSCAMPMPAKGAETQANGASTPTLKATLNADPKRLECYGVGANAARLSADRLASMHRLGLHPQQELDKQKLAWQECIPGYGEKSTDYSLPHGGFYDYETKWSKRLLPLLSWSTDMSWYMEQLLKRDYSKQPGGAAGPIRVLLYAGEHEYRANWVGMYRSAKALNWPGKKGFAAAFAKLKPETPPPVKSTTDDRWGNAAGSKNVRLRHSKSKVVVVGASYFDYASDVKDKKLDGGGAAGGSERTLAFARIDKSSSRPAEEHPEAMVAVLRHFIQGK